MLMDFAMLSLAIAIGLIAASFLAGMFKSATASA